LQGLLSRSSAKFFKLGFFSVWRESLDNFNYTPIDAPKPKHSSLGIASLVIAVISILLFCLGLGVAVFASASDPATFDSMPSDSPLYLPVGLMICFGGGLFQPDRNKTFAILGTVFNLLFLCAVGVLMVIGNLAP
jgi:hypothetical protein